MTQIFAGHTEREINFEPLETVQNGEGTSKMLYPQVPSMPRTSSGGRVSGDVRQRKLPKAKPSKVIVFHGLAKCLINNECATLLVGQLKDV